MTRTFEIRRTEVDGVPTFWADTPPGPFIASLMFRVGRSDEPAPWGGITHLVEHLALAPLGQQPYDHNGIVEPNRTAFFVVGDEEEATGFLRAATANLGALPLDRLLIERRILAQEQAQSSQGIGAAVRAFRFGFTSHGWVADDQAGLAWLGPDTIEGWRRAWFTRQNAALVLSGPPPAGLKLDLPDGQRRAVAPIEDLNGVVYPTHVAWDLPGTSLSLQIRRAIHSTVLNSIVERRARQRLRFDRGLVYDVVADYDALDGENAIMLVGSDCPPEHINEVTTILLEVLDDLATNGPTSAELETEASGFLRHFVDRSAQFGYMDSLAENSLQGANTPDPDEVLERREALEPAVVASALRDAMPSLMLLAAGDRPDARFHPYPMNSGSMVTGTEYRPAGRHLPGRGPKERLIAGADGLTFLTGAGEPRTVRFKDAVLVQHYDGDVRAVQGRDGYRVTVAAADWRDGHQVIGLIDRSVDPETVACDEHGIGGLVDPQAQGARSG